MIIKVICVKEIMKIFMRINSKSSHNHRIRSYKKTMTKEKKTRTTTIKKNTKKETVKLRMKEKKTTKAASLNSFKENFSIHLIIKSSRAKQVVILKVKP